MVVAKLARGHDERHLDRYLLRSEQVIVATHRHWAAVAEPLLTAAAALLVVAALAREVADRSPNLVELLLLAWLVLFGRAVIAVWEWNREWVVATDRRMLLVYGFIIRKVAMLPMTKVTDMTFHRSILGRLLGYGTFILESAGQDQALSDLHFIPRPNDTYLKIVGTIFQREGDDDVVEVADGDETRGRRLDVDDVEIVEYVAEDDPTGRPALRQEVARLGQSALPRGDRHGRTPSLSGGAGPVRERDRRRSGGEPYTETLYSSFETSSGHGHRRAAGDRRWPSWRRDR